MEIIDIDLLIELQENTPNIYELKHELREFVGSRFQRNVDVAREKYLKKAFKDRILKETIYVGERHAEPGEYAGSHSQNEAYTEPLFMNCDTMGNPMNIPDFITVDDMAQFWDSHDVIEFEDELIEVKEPIFDHLQRRAITVMLDVEHSMLLNNILRDS